MQDASRWASVGFSVENCDGIVKIVVATLQSLSCCSLAIIVGTEVAGSTERQYPASSRSIILNQSQCTFHQQLPRATNQVKLMIK
jgi:hypothetical protein